MIHQIIELTWDGEPADFSFEVYPHLLSKFGGKLVCAELKEDAQPSVQADECKAHAANAFLGFKFCPDCGQPFSTRR